MEKKPNTTCKICGKRYYHCKDCERINSWRLVACSPECWNIWCDQIEARRNQQVNEAAVEEVAAPATVKTPKLSVGKVATKEPVTPVVVEDEISSADEDVIEDDEAEV